MDTVICGLNAAAIAALKAKHGYLFVVTVSDGESNYNAICKEPTMEAIESSSTVGAASGDMKGSMVLYDNCLLHADTDIQNRYLLKMEVLKEITAKMQSFKTSSKNL